MRNGPREVARLASDRVAYTERAAAWDLRGAWATQREVVVVLEGNRGRVRGYVEHVSASNAYALIYDGAGTAHVPLAFAAAVRRPHFHEPLDGIEVTPPPRRRRRTIQLSPGQLALFGGPTAEERRALAEQAQRFEPALRALART